MEFQNFPVNISDLEEIIASWIEPHQEMDIKASILKSAALHSLSLQNNFPQSCQVALLNAWLNSKNQQDDAEENFTAYLPIHPIAYLKLAEILWSDTHDSPWGQDLLMRTLLRWKNSETVQSILPEIFEHWLGFVHPAGHPIRRHAKKQEDIDALKKTIDLLKKQKEELEKEVEEMIDESGCDSDTINKYTSIPGVSHYTASVSSLFFSGDYNLSSKQWIAFAGMDVSVRESGRWRGKGKLTKRGNGYLRKRLFQAAWGAKMHNDDFKRYYNHLRDKGKSYVEALMIIARKIVIIMFNLSKNNECYDASKLSFLAA